MRYARKVPESRLLQENFENIDVSGDYVLHWMTSARRFCRNFGLQRAAEWAAELERPLLVVEPLFIDEPWASARFHRFLLDGMVSNLLNGLEAGVDYVPLVERAPGDALRAALELAEKACVITTDSFPGRAEDRRLQIFAARMPVRVESVDSNGIVPLQEHPGEFPSAVSFRRFLQSVLPTHLSCFPQPLPLSPNACSVELPAGFHQRWKVPSFHELQGPLETQLSVDHSVEPVAMAGGALAARLQLTHFLKVGIEQYPEARKHPVCDNTSRLSAYLHFGHLGAHDVVAELLEYSDWSIDQVSPKANGRKAGWWGLSEAAEMFLDQVITWRELGYGFCRQRLEDYDTYDGLPEWARETLDEHASDDRPVQYSLSELEGASTEDPLWNAAQRQLVMEGRIHGYLRMLWGKRILEWCSHPRVALEWMITLNNRYALDGRNPNSYSGIQWTLGRFDRPWGPVRPIFGKVRYMSSARTYHKMDTAPYLERYGPDRDLEEPDGNLQRSVVMRSRASATHGK